MPIPREGRMGQGTPTSRMTAKDAIDARTDRTRSKRAKAGSQGPPGCRCARFGSENITTAPTGPTRERDPIRRWRLDLPRRPSLVLRSIGRPWRPERQQGFEQGGTPPLALRAAELPTRASGETSFHRRTVSDRRGGDSDHRGRQPQPTRQSGRVPRQTSISGGGRDHSPQDPEEDQALPRVEGTPAEGQASRQRQEAATKLEVGRRMTPRL